MYTTVQLQFGLIKIIKDIRMDPEPNVKNITAGPTNHIQAPVADPCIYPLTYKILARQWQIQE